MNYLRKFLLRGLFGIALGVFINQLTYLIIALQGGVIQINSNTVIQQFLLSSLVGFYCMGISVIFDVEEWSLLRQTVTHSMAMLVYFPVAVYAGWMPTTFIGRVLFIVNYMVIYLVIWFSIKRYWQRKAKELNEGLRRRRTKGI